MKKSPSTKIKSFYPVKTLRRHRIEVNCLFALFLRGAIRRATTKDMRVLAPCDESAFEQKAQNKTPRNIYTPKKHSHIHTPYCESGAKMQMIICRCVRPYKSLSV